MSASTNIGYLAQSDPSAPYFGKSRAYFEQLGPQRDDAPKALILDGYGLNCEAESAAPFEMLGIVAHTRHIAELLSASKPDLGAYGIIVFPGGFSFGDHVSAGRILANRLRYRFAEDLLGFAERGGLILGMCNGFQVMVKMGLLPNGYAQQDGAGQSSAKSGPSPNLSQMQATVSLVNNAKLGYRNAWVTLGIDPQSPCVFTRGMSRLECPSRHGEGRFVFQSPEQPQRLQSKGQIPLRYLDQKGQPTEAWPHNPNGSAQGAAALCDVSGRIFGLMPHPEAYLYPENHPRWRRFNPGSPQAAYGAGLSLFANAVAAMEA